MSGVPMLTALVVGSSLALCVAPVSSPAQPKPDVLVTFGSTIQEPTAVRVQVFIGNQSNIPPAPDVDYVAAMTVLTASSQVVCESQVLVATVAPNSSRLAFHFVLSYPASGAQLSPGLALTRKSMKYRVIARATPTKSCPNYDSFCGNNTVTREFQFPVGGTPACIRLLPP